MKPTITILFTAITFTVFGQRPDFNALLDSAKSFFKNEKTLNQEQLDKLDYAKAAADLEKATAINTTNTEAKYYLGYIYSRINSRDGRSMIDMNLPLTIKTSEQFEKINKLTPKYTGEIIVLDPYSKLSSEWGAMAMSYWHHNKPDSSIWAFKEGKKRGGFGDYILGLNKKVLDACSQNSILISSGDNFTIPLWYLQIVKGYRKDVSVIDISLLNAPWYPAYLSKNKIASFDLPNEVLDTLEYVKWVDSTITISNFSWTVKPSYDQYLLRGDRVFLSLLRQNKFKRDLFFTIAFMEDSRLSLKNYLTPYVEVDKLTVSAISVQSYSEYKKSISGMLQLSRHLNMNSPDELRLFDNFRYNLFGQIDEYLTKSDIKKAKELMEILDTYGNEKKFPYEDEKATKYVNYLRERM